MQYATPSCQLHDLNTGDSSAISLHAGDTQRPHTVTEAHQWLATTTGRIATCAHSWMQAVHWISGAGIYTPTRQHGPRWGQTTLQIAQEIAALTECRPSVDYLARKLRISERTVQYHLGMLRETGLLVYRSKGTRLSGVGGRASEFERTIPTVFDEALGIRTVGKGATRRPCGAAEASRKTLGQLARKASRKVRRRRPKTPVSGRRLCTPMQGGTSTVSSAGSTHSPSESKLASGEEKSPTAKSSKRGPRKLNQVGRRYQLAGELISSVPWLAKASRPRIAWIVKDVSDAGWTAEEVRAAAELMPVAADDARRPSGLLAYRLASCHLLYTTTAHRQALVEDWRESRTAEQARHTGFDTPMEGGRGPASVSVQRLVADAFSRTRQADTADAYTTCHAEGNVDLEALDRDVVRQMRADAEADPQLILSALELMPERDVRRLYTNWLVDQTLKTSRTLTPAF